MNREPEIDFSPTAPRWTWRPLLLALLMTGLLYILIPMTESMTEKPEAEYVLRELEQTRMPPPFQEPPPPPPPEVEPSTRPLPLPEPRPAPPAQPQPPLKLPVDLSPAVSGLEGIARNAFQVEEAGLPGGLSMDVFEISDLDRPPRPISRMNPAYPPRARMRRQEGYVVVEFVVGVDGGIQEIKIVDGEPGEVFESAVERAVRSWRFEPGEVQGRAVPARVRQRIDFTLE